MRIIGHGIDITQIRRIKEEIDSSSKCWTDKFFSAEERQQSDSPPMHYRYYAGRYAGKEAVAKALGTGFAGEITWRGIEILRGVNGAPFVRLRDEVLEFSKSQNIGALLISISYTTEVAMASVIAVSD